MCVFVRARAQGDGGGATVRADGNEVRQDAVPHIGQAGPTQAGLRGACTRIEGAHMIINI
jgi:hypothetical protein